MSQVVTEQKKEEQQQQYPSYQYYPYPYYPYYTYNQTPTYPPPSPPSSLSSPNGNNRRKVFRLSWGLLMAFALAGALAVAFGLGGYYVGITMQSMLGTGASNTLMSSEVMHQFNYTLVSSALQSMGSQQLNVALSLPTQATDVGSLLGAIIGFLLGLYYEHKNKNKPSSIE